jgi:hypothetical protein
MTPTIPRGTIIRKTNGRTAIERGEHFHKREACGGWFDSAISALYWAINNRFRIGESQLSALFLVRRRWRSSGRLFFHEQYFPFVRLMIDDTAVGHREGVAGLLGRIVLNTWREQIFKYLIRDHNTLSGIQFFGGAAA